MSTMTSPTGIRFASDSHKYTFQSCFVRYHLSQTIERHSTNQTTHTTTFLLCPFTDTSQITKNNYSVFQVCLINNVTANLMQNSVNLTFLRIFDFPYCLQRFSFAKPFSKPSIMPTKPTNISAVKMGFRNLSIVKQHGCRNGSTRTPPGRNPYTSAASARDDTHRARRPIAPR